MNNLLQQSIFKMPAEWYPHAATWACLPFDDEIWHGHLKEVRKEYVQLIQKIAQYEPVHLFVNNTDDSFDFAHIAFQNNKNVILHQIQMDDVWFRDNGPIFVQTNNDVTTLKWQFNAWGQKYPFQNDNNVAYETFKILNCGYVPIDMVFEGGGIEVNGLGLALTTKQCLLNPNRNPGFNVKTIESYLNKYLGIQYCIWLNQGLEGDHTDGHIDTIARFANENTVICVYTDDAADPNHKIMQENLNILHDAAQDHHLNIVKLPLPQNKIYHGTLRIPCTYANFYMSHKFVIMPMYDDPNDAIALDILKSTFPNHDVVGLPSKHIILGGGSFHCLTQQQPQGNLTT